MTRWLPDTGRTLVPETTIGEADRLSQEVQAFLAKEHAALKASAKRSAWVEKALAGQLPAKDLTPHRTPGFTAEDQLEGKRGKRKSLDAQRTQRAATQRRAIAIDTRR